MFVIFEMSIYDHQPGNYDAEYWFKQCKRLKILDDVETYLDDQYPNGATESDIDEFFTDECQSWVSDEYGFPRNWDQISYTKLMDMD